MQCELSQMNHWQSNLVAHNCLRQKQKIAVKHFHKSQHIVYLLSTYTTLQIATPYFVATEIETTSRGARSAVDCMAWQIV